MHQRSCFPMATATTTMSSSAAAAASSSSFDTSIHDGSIVPVVIATNTISSPRSFKIVRCMMLSLVLLVVLISAVIAIAWLIFNPRPPTFRLDSLSLSGLPNASDASSPPPELHVRVQLTANNPNKKVDMVIQDANFCLALVHHKPRLSISSPTDTSSSENYISKRDHRVVIFQVNAGPRPGHRTRRKRSFPFAVAEDLREGPALMSVIMKVSIKFTYGYWPSKRASVKVECNVLSISLSSSRRVAELKNGGNDCSVHFA